MFAYIIQLIKSILNYPSKVGKAVDDFVEELRENIEESRKYNGYTNDMFKQLKEQEERLEEKRNCENKKIVLANQLMSAQEKKDHLKSEYWRLLKVNKLVQHGNYCEKCGKLNKHLDLHHLHYRTLGFESANDVVLLCRSCHTRQHNHYGYDRKTDYSEVV